MPAIFEFPHTVTPEEIDVLGHVNNLNYLRWLVDAAVAHSAAQGWPGSAYHTLGAGWVVRSHFIEYLQPTFEGDEVVVRTWVANLKKVTSLRRYQVIRPRDAMVLATGATDWAFIHFRTGMVKRIPPEVGNAFEVVPDEPGEAI